jgi:hypothetical protein
MKTLKLQYQKVHNKLKMQDYVITNIKTIFDLKIIFSIFNNIFVYGFIYFFNDQKFFFNIINPNNPMRSNFFFTK